MKESGLRIQHNLTSRRQHNEHPDGTKKTTHALHRRLAFTSSVSTADVVRLPNWAEFCIRGGIVKYRRDEH
jgi:hypothetical protein